MGETAQNLLIEPIFLKVEPQDHDEEEKEDYLDFDGSTHPAEDQLLHEPSVYHLRTCKCVLVERLHPSHINTEFCLSNGISEESAAKLKANIEEFCQTPNRVPTEHKPMNVTLEENLWENIDEEIEQITATSSRDEFLKSIIDDVEHSDNPAEELAHSILKCSYCYFKCRDAEQLLIHVSKEHSQHLQSRYSKPNSELNSANAYPEKTFIKVNGNISYTSLPKRQRKQNEKSSGGKKLFLQQLFSCPDCNYSCSRSHSLQEHRRIHEENLLKCSECDFQTTSAGSLTRHRSKCHMDLLQCSHCDFKTMYKGIMENHERIHTGNLINCKFCDFKSVRYRDVYNHVQTAHTGKHIYECTYSQCVFKTMNASSFKAHIRQHTGQFLECSFCIYKTPYTYALKEHLRKHTGKELKCSYCDFKTPYNKAYSVHIRKHNGDSYNCKYCDFKTIYLDSIRTHERKHNNEMLKCSHCDFSTPSDAVFRSHMRKHTGNVFKCSECQYSTLRYSQLKNHLRKHTGELLRCSLCEFTTRRDVSMRHHKLTHTSTVIKCPQCEFTTPVAHVMRQHERIHNELYFCSFCKYSSCRKTAVKRHEDKYCPQLKRNKIYEPDKVVVHVKEEVIDE